MNSLPTALAANCILCDHQGEMQILYPKYGIVRCPECGLVFYPCLEQPTADLYAQDYFNGEEYFDYVADRAVLQKNFRRRLNTLARYVPNGRLLDIGAAYGFFLDVAKEHWEVRGIDVAAEATAYGRERLGLDVRTANFLEVPDEPCSWDIITMWDTIEHLQEPHRFIEKASRWLKPGGILVMTTGDVQSRLSRLQGDRWRLIHPPTHLFYFSPTTLETMVAKSGLQTVEVRHVGYYRSLNAMLYGLLVLGKKRHKSAYRFLTLGGRLDLSLYLNLHDIMLLVAQKPV